MKKLSIASKIKARALAHLLLIVLLWVPAAGWAQTTSWTPVASSNTPKWVGFSVMINSKMYVFSGFDNSSVHTTPKCEVYDPVANTWSYLADMPTPVTHAGIAVDGPKVYVAGGFLGGLVGDPNADLLQVYDVPTNTWSTGPKLPTRSGGNALVRVGRKLHSFGGMLDDRQTGSTAHYVLDLDNVAAGWTTAAGLPSPRCHFASACVAGKIYAMGGQTGHDGPIADVGLVQAYDPSTDAWTQLNDMPYVRSHSEPATFVLDGKVFLVGGRSGRPNGTDNVLNTVTSYDPAADSWAEQVPLPVHLFGPAAEAIGSELIVSNGSLDFATNPQTTARKIGLTLAPNNKIGFLPGTLNLAATAGAAATKTALLWTLSGNPSYAIAPGTLPAWLSVSPAAGTVDLLGGTEIKVTASAAALAAGTYSATVTAKATGYPDASLSVVFTVSGARPKVLYLYGSVPPGIHDMKLADTGARGMSQFNQLLIDSGFSTAEALDASVTLNAATLNGYKVLVLGSNNRRFTAAERTAVASWVNAGGGLVAWTDAAFGGGDGNFNSSEGSLSDNDLTDQFGLHFLHDNGLSVFTLNQWAVDHYINKFNKNAGLTIEAEGVSPVRTSAPATILANLPAGKAQLNPTDGPLTPADAALSVAKIGQGRVAGYFDRNAFWNNGEGTFLSRVDNKTFAQRLILWVSGVDDSNPVPSAPVANAGSNQTLTLPTSSAVLSGTGAAASGRTVTAYTWAQNSGPTTAAFSSKTAAGPTVSGLAAGSYVFSLVVTDNTGAASAASLVTINVNAASGGGTVVYRLKAGGGALATSLGPFAADQYYAPAPGNTYSSAAAIAGTTNDALYQTERYGTVGQFAYALPVANGTYTVVLHFAETYWVAAGKRVFDVSAEGTKVLAGYDIYKKVGANAATTETFAVSVTDGLLNVDFTSLNAGGVDQPKLAALEVFAAAATTSPPVANAGSNQALTLPASSAVLSGTGAAASGRTVAGYAWSQNSGPTTAAFSSKTAAGPTVSGLAAGSYVFSLVVTDNAGAASAPSQVTVTVNPAPAGGGTVVYRLKAGGGALATTLGTFAADQYYTAATSYVYATGAAIAGTPDQALYRSERSSSVDRGAFGYALPVANGTYTVVLHFADIYWSAVGQRLFDVRLEGTTVLDNYDIIAKVGPFTATTERFTTTVTDGVLNVDFSSLPADGGVDRPKLSALEVFTAASAAGRGLAAAAVKAITVGMENDKARAYPVPTADGRVHVALGAAAAGPVAYTLLSPLGAVLARGRRPAAGGFDFDFAGPMAAPGVYFLLLEGPGGATRLKLLRR